MKTKMFGALALAMLVGFVACNPKEDPATKVTGVTVSPKSVDLDENNTSVRLTATLTPSGAVGTVAWSSSDTTVATVDSVGNVQARSLGSCQIVATCGEFNDACEVSVRTYLENIDFTNAILWDVDTTYFGGIIDTIEASAGGTYYCYRTLGTFYLMSDGFYVNESGYLDGSVNGTIIEVKAPFSYATKSLNGGQGVVFTLGWYAITDKYEFGETMHVAKPGKLDENAYIAAMKKFVNGYNTATTTEELSAAYDNLDSAWAEGVLNTDMYTLTYHSTEEEYPQDGYYNPLMADGVCTGGSFYLSDEGVSKYMYGIEYDSLETNVIDNFDYVWGCNWNFAEGTNYTGNTISWEDEDLHMRSIFTYIYGEKPQEEGEAPKYKESHMPVLCIDYPEVAAQISEQLNRRDTRVLRVQK